MAYDALKTEIRQYINTNGQEEITGQILQNVLLDMVNAYPSLDGYATQLWVQNQISDMATMTWVGQQGFITNSALANYLPLSGGVMTGPITAGTLSTGSYSLGNTGLSFEYSYNGNPRYAHAIRISSVDGTITFIGRGGASTGTVITGGNITSGGFIVSGGTSSDFLKADGSLDSNTYLTTADLSSYVTETWVGNNYLALNGGTMTGPITAGTLSTGSYSLGNTGLSFEYSYNGNPRYAHAIRISSVDGTITFIGRGGASTGTVITGGNITSGGFIVSGGTSSQFLKADGSIDNTSYLPLTGGMINGNLSVFNNLYVGSRLNISAEGGTPEDPESYEFWLDNGEINIDNQTVITRTNITANAFVMNNGTSAQFLKADGSVDSNTYLTSAAISDMATQTWVGQQGFLTSVPSGYATETWVGNNYLPLTGGNLSGSLGINTNSASYPLDVHGNARVESLYINDFSTDNYGYGRIWVDSDGINISGAQTSANQIYLTNKTYIASTLDVDGNTSIYGTCSATSFINTSDLRRKNVIENVGLTLGDIANAPLFRFDWKDEKNYSGMHIGTSAQYWQTITPELVTVCSDEMQTLAMQYDVLALAGVITVAKRVVDHEARIAELEKENASLKAKLNIN